MIVLDASAVFEMIIGKDNSALVFQSIADSSELICAPEIIDLEVIQALRRHINLKWLTPVESENIFGIFTALPLMRMSHQPLTTRIWELKSNMTAYDASYVALAEQLDAPLWTFDGKYTRTPGHNAKIRLFQPAP